CKDTKVSHAHGTEPPELWCTAGEEVTGKTLTWAVWHPAKLDSRGRQNFLTSRAPFFATGRRLRPAADISRFLMRLYSRGCHGHPTQPGDCLSQGSRSQVCAR